MRLQSCPHCRFARDVSLFVAGQWVRCSRCGERFEVGPDGEAPQGRVAPPAAASDPPGPLERGEGGAPDADPAPDHAPDAEPAPDRAGAAAQRRWLAGAVSALVVLSGAVAWGALSPGVGAPVGGSEGTPHGAAPGSGPLILPLAARIDAGESERWFDFESGGAGTWPWYTWRGRWALSDGALVHTPVQPAPSRIPRAFLGRERYLAEGVRIEARALVVPSGEHAAATDGPAVELYLYRNRRRFVALTARPGPDGGYTLVWDLGDGMHYGAIEGGADLLPPAPGSPFRLALWVDAGVLHGAVDDREIGRARIEGLGEDDWGKAGVGCRAARCVVDAFLVRGRVRPAPGDDVSGALVVPGASR